MAEGLQRDQWFHTSHIMREIANVLVTKERDLRQWWDFHPFYNGQVASDDLPWNMEDDPENPRMRTDIDMSELKAFARAWGSE